MVVPVYAYGSGSDGGAILVYDTKQRYNAAWPHLLDPRLGGGGGDAPPTGGDGEGFDATFTLGENVNNWWVEVFVKANEPVSKVQAQVDGGSWSTLDKKSWGSWADSFHVPTGASVVFRAFSVSGAGDTSGTFRWLQGDEPAEPPPSGGTFEATFTVSDNVNNWWVEVGVDASEPLRAVHARVDGGGWVALEKQSWGTWAESFFVRDGAQVQFRATSTDGDTATSATFSWLREGGSGGGGTFSADFDLGNVNNWWVEVYVKGTEPVAQVAARVDGGAWRGLDEKSWGAWAESFFVPDGAQVQFRATSSDGDTALSGGFTWR